MNELAGQSLGGYQLEEEIGRGSMGMVYRGKQIALGREVAVKVLPQALARDASYVARFIREAQIIAGLNHPNIVHIYDAGQQNKLLYFVMEYVQGPTLASLLHLDGIIPQYLAVEYAAQIADALDSAYAEHNVIHRDIKPENLMLDRWGKIRVMDFGLARAMGHQPITVAKTLVGSIYYASPEQVWGSTLDNRSDIYALGVVLYEMVSGKRPFTGRAMPELTQAIISGQPQPPSTHNVEIVPELERIILTAMARDREQRYQSAGLFARDLRSLNLRSPHDSFSLHAVEMGVYPASTVPKQAWERTVMHPPKRPQARHPQYGDGGDHLLHPQQPQHLPAAPINTPPPLNEQALREEQEKVPTIPLEPAPATPRYEESHNRDAFLPIEHAPTRKIPVRLPLWSQLQRFFRSRKATH